MTEKKKGKEGKKNVEIRFSFFNHKDREEFEKKAREKGLTASNYARMIVYEQLKEE